MEAFSIPALPREGLWMQPGSADAQKLKRKPAESIVFYRLRCPAHNGSGGEVRIPRPPRSLSNLEISALRRMPNWREAPEWYPGRGLAARRQARAAPR